MLADHVSTIRSRILDSTVDLSINHTLVYNEIHSIVMKSIVDNLSRGASFYGKTKKSGRFYRLEVERAAILWCDGDFSADSCPEELPNSGTNSLIYTSHA